MTIVEIEAAEKTGAEGAGLEAAGTEFDGAEMTGAGIQHPEAAGMETRAVRHRQPLGDDLAGCDIDDRAALGPPIAPAIDDVAAADGADIGRPAVRHGHAVQVAAVLGSQPADELRPPIGAKAVDLAQGRKARIERVDEDDPAVAHHPELVDVKVAGGAGEAGKVVTVLALVAALAAAQ